MRTGLFAKALGAQLMLAFCASHGSAAPCVARPASPQAIAQFKSNQKYLVTA
jgi:hypothetical protein